MVGRWYNAVSPFHFLVKRTGALHNRGLCIFPARGAFDCDHSVNPHGRESLPTLPMPSCDRARDGLLKLRPRKSRLLWWAISLITWSAAAQTGQDLRFTYRSEIDNTDQPYRVYVPSSYRPDQPIAMVFALHQTGDNENSLFEDEKHYPAKLGVRSAAEKYGVLLVSPNARGTTEYRGIGENDIFCVLADVKKRFRVDENRIYLTGHSMGGTGSAYLALHHPDLFAAAAPLAAAYSFPWLAANAGHVPFLWVGGELDAEYYRQGVALGLFRMKSLGCPVEFLELAGQEHYGTAKDFHRVFEWLLRHRRVAHPTAFTFEVDSPRHARAYWLAVEAMEQPGKIATVKGRAESRQLARLELENVREVAFWPDPAVFDVARPLRVKIKDEPVFTGVVSPAQEIVFNRAAAGWTAQLRSRREYALTTYRRNPVAFAPEALDMEGTESRLANWITDAMRLATGGDIALYSRRSYRRLPLPAGTVDMVDLIQCSRPFDQMLVTAQLSGRDIIEILDANVQDPAAVAKGGIASNLLVQMSGGQYRFDRRLPPGRRIVSSSFQPERIYTVVLEGQVVQRETMRLAGRFRKLDHRVTNIPFTVALQGHAARSRELRAVREGRVEEVK